MNKLFTYIFLGLLLINIVSAVPKIQPYVNDFANVLTPEQETSLNSLCDSIEKNTTYEIVIVTLQNTEGQDRIEYANDIGDENGVGKKDKNNGIVVLWSLDNEKGGAIATGRGSESIFNDAKVGRIGRESRQYFDNGSYYEGFNYILLKINNEIISKENLTDLQDSNDTPNAEKDLVFIILFILIFLIVLFIVFSISDSDSSSSYSNYRTGYGYSHSGSSSHSSGGFGGGSFGGGGFGGGGAKF